MKTNAIHKTAMLAAIGFAVGLPAVACADQAVGLWSGESLAPVPHIPGTFAGAPTNDDPSTGQFTISFDENGFTRMGRLDEPPVTIDLTTERERRAASARWGNFATETEFSGFRAQLRTLGSRAVAQKTASR